MQNEMRDRLVEIFRQNGVGEAFSPLAREEWRKDTADVLIANGVIVPPCKVGDKLYEIVDMSAHPACDSFVSDFSLKVEPYQIIYRNLIGGYSCIPFEQFGKTVFLTKEEAEKALKEGADNG